MLVQLVAEEAVLLVQVVDGASVLVDVALHLQPQNIDHLLSVVQPQPQRLSFCMQSLTSALGLFQQGKMLEKSIKINEPSEWAQSYLMMVYT